MFKIKISYNKIFRYLTLLLIFVSIITIVFVGYFLYKNFYQTITQSDEILNLRREVALEDINMDKFEKIIKKIEEKVKLRSINVFK